MSKKNSPETIVGEILILPPFMEVYSNHTPSLQLFLSKHGRPVVLGRGLPKHGETTLVNSKRANFNIIQYDSEKPCPSPRRVLATWDQISDRHLSMIKNGTLKGRVSLQRIGDRAELDEKGHVTLLKNVMRKI